MARRKMGRGEDENGGSIPSLFLSTPRIKGKRRYQYMALLSSLMASLCLSICEGYISASGLASPYRQGTSSAPNMLPSWGSNSFCGDAVVASRLRLSQSRASSGNLNMGLFNPAISGDDNLNRSQVGRRRKLHTMKKQLLKGITKPRSRVALQSLFSKARTTVKSLALWRKNHLSPRNALAAAALAFSVMFCASSANEMPMARDANTNVNSCAPAPQQKPAVVLPHSAVMNLKGGGGGVALAPSAAARAKASGWGESASQPKVRRRVTIFRKADSEKNTQHLPQAAITPKNKNAEQALEDVSRATTKTLREAIDGLAAYMAGPKSDTLILLLATALVTPVCKQLGTSPILGFLASGMLLGPNGFGLISGIHTTETLAELGIVFFLFEMGIELSLERLASMRHDVFGLGLSQFLTTAIAVAGVGSLFGLPANALVVLGGGLALSSSAFVLQLLKDKDALATRFGKASFGVLLFQDLAVVPLLVVTPILAGGGGGLAAALGSAVVKASMALGSIAFVGRVMLNPLFRTVAQAQSQEAFLGVVLLTVLSMSFMTEGLGLSNTLGAFLAGVLLSETKYRYQIEADIAPFRGVLLGLFFVTVGFEIDVRLIASNLPVVGGVVVGLVALKAFITTALSLAFGLSLANAQQTGLILAQGGEFAFVAFGLARGLGILDPAFTKLMLTCVSLSMAITPALSEVGSKIAKRLEEDSDFTHYLGQDRDANEIKGSDGFTVVIGYGAVGRVVCDLLDRKFIKYVGIEVDPNRAIQARNKGLPVFYGDIGRPEVAEAFNVGNAKAVIVTISEKAEANRAIIGLRRLYPQMKIFARAFDADHAQRLQKTLDVVAMVPILPEDNVLMTLPFGGAVLKSLGAPPEEVNAILEAKRKDVLSGRGLADLEEETVLTQLGIITEPKKEKDQKENKEDSVVSSEDDASNDDLHSTMVAAAEAAVEETKEKNPMVAQAIAANVPSDKEPSPVIDAEILGSESESAADDKSQLQTSDGVFE